MLANISVGVLVTLSSLFLHSALMCGQTVKLGRGYLDIYFVR